VHVDTIVRAAHLLPIFGEAFVLEKTKYVPRDSSYIYCGFHANKFADHHSSEIAPRVHYSQTWSLHL
ncbi:hypothetical protein EV424DRAFT_1330483, partial [Suillus variegatus]